MPDLSENQIRQIILEELDTVIEACSTLESSSKLLNFCVSDMLSLAQINNNKFRKNFSNFDIRKSVKEVMKMQMDKANYSSIVFKTEFINFDNNFIISTDEQRVQQVLLNLQSNALKFTGRGGKVTIICTLK